MATEIQGGNQTKEIKEGIAGARAGLRDAFDRGSEKAAHIKDAAFDRGRSALATFERAIEERPFVVLGGVFAGGLILGMLLRRR